MVRYVSCYCCRLRKWFWLSVTKKWFQVKKRSEIANHVAPHFPRSRYQPPFSTVWQRFRLEHTTKVREPKYQLQKRRRSCGNCVNHMSKAPLENMSRTQNRNVISAFRSGNFLTWKQICTLGCASGRNFQGDFFWCPIFWVPQHQSTVDSSSVTLWEKNAP